MNSYNPYSSPAANGFFGHSAPPIAPMSASPFAADGSGLTPQGWGWLTDVVKAVVPIVLSQLSTTPGANIAPMSATPAFSPMTASPNLTPQGWGWLTDVVKAVVPIVLSQLSATPNAGIAPMAAGPALSPYGGFIFSGPSVSTPFGNFGAGGVGFNW
jgi:hypothetical protein